MLHGSLLWLLYSTGVIYMGTICSFYKFFLRTLLQTRNITSIKQNLYESIKMTIVDLTSLEISESFLLLSLLLICFYSSYMSSTI